MRVTIEIQCDSDAFYSYAGDELARILRGVADRWEGEELDTRVDSHPLQDANGNTVGHVRVTD